MVLSLILFLLAVGITMFHYVEGAFTATLSAMLAMIAAVVAVGYHESVAQFLVDQKFPDIAEAVALVVVFAVVYIIPRFLLDKFIPGNIRLPVLADKIIAGVMGFVAGLFCTGVLGIAAQTLPFGASIGMFAKYPLREVPGTFSNLRGQREEVLIEDALNGDTLAPENASHLWFHPDELVLGLTSSNSNGGSLAGQTKFTDVHPDYLTELFGARLGVPVGAKHSAVNTDSTVTVKLAGVYHSLTLPQVDSDTIELRPSDYKKPDPIFKPANETILVVRLLMSDAGKALADSDSFVRFSPASARLVANDENNNRKNYYPVGTLDARHILFANRLDDTIYVDLSKGERSVDLVFSVPSTPGQVINLDKQKKINLGPDVFLEVKHFARIDLKNADVAEAIPEAKNEGVLRKKLPLEAADKLGVTAISADEVPAADDAGTPAKPAKKPKKPKVAAPAPAP